MRNFRYVKFNLLLVKSIIYRIIAIIIYYFLFGKKVALVASCVAFVWYYIYDWIFTKFYGITVKTKGKILWLTGLSGSGKTTLSNELKKRLQKKGKQVQQLDGDILRKTVSKDLDFSLEDRTKNLERAIEVANLLSNNNIIVICSFISPIRKLRDNFRKRFSGKFIEIYVNSTLEICEKRDVKGLYKKARSGKIKSFTGISQPYEEPICPHIECFTDIESIEESTNKIMNYLQKYHLL